MVNNIDQKMNGYSPLFLSLIVVVGAFAARLVWHSIFNQWTDYTVNYFSLISSFFSLHWIVLNILPMIVIVALGFARFNVAVTLRNCIHIFWITVVLSLLLNGIMFIISWSIFDWISIEMMTTLTAYLLVPLNLLLEPVIVQLLLVMFVKWRTVLKQESDPLSLNHTMTLLILLCAVITTFYWIMIWIAAFNQRTLELSIVFSALVVCFIYDRVKYDVAFNVQMASLSRLISIVILLILASVVSYESTNYIIEIYRGKYIANLIIKIFLNGLSMMILTQMIMRKILYRI